MKKFLWSTVSLFISYISLQAQAQWQRQHANIETRWASHVNPQNVLSEYPRPQMIRANWINLNGLWQYAITNKVEQIPVKFDGNILVPYPVESALSGVKKSLDPRTTSNGRVVPRNILWYKKTFTPPVLKLGERLFLNFGAVSWEATIYINGKHAGTHTGSYTAFSLDVTEFIKRGKNEIAVKVSNPLEEGIGPRGKQTKNPASIWYTPSSGIWQTVWLEKLPANHIKAIKIAPDVDRSEVRIKVDAVKDAAVSITAAGQTVEGTTNKEMVIPVSNPRLWSPDDPYLYDVSIILGSDVVKSYFGMRKIEIKKDTSGIERIYLNNKYTYNLGTLDQGFWPDGLYTAPTDEALKFDIQASKAMGFNTIRKHIKIEPARWYYHADKLGMLVWQDMVQPAVPLSEASKIQFEKESSEVLKQLNNYPCIITWVLFNESWGEFDQERLTKWVKNIDPARLVNGHSGAAIVDGVISESKIKDVVLRSINSDMTDVHSYPPPAIPNHIEGKAMVLGEFGGIGVQVEGHVWDDVASGWGYGGTVSAGTMHKQYSVMIDSLVAFERRGLSGSIYTQPFDVESEQNGLITYDREILKIPAAEIRNIHAKLWPPTANYAATTKSFTVRIADSAKRDFATALIEYKAGKKDSASLRGLALLAAAEKDTLSQCGRKFANEYVKLIKNPFVEVNLKFINRFLRSTTDAGFPIFYTNIKKVNSVLGSDAAEAKITAAIANDEIKPHQTRDGIIDWATIEKNAVAKYGSYGEEAVWQAMVFEAINSKNWKQFASAGKKWFNKYGNARKWISEELLNSLAWATFEGTNDIEALKVALALSKKSIGSDPVPYCIDTYANLLYKLGEKEKAVEWETKAVELNPDEMTFKETLEKMKRGEKTWME